MNAGSTIQRAQRVVGIAAQQTVVDAVMQAVLIPRGGFGVLIGPNRAGVVSGAIFIIGRTAGGIAGMAVRSNSVVSNPLSSKEGDCSGCFKCFAG